MIKAAKNYDEHKEVAFSTFAVRCIQNTIGVEFVAKNALKRKSNENTVSLSAPVLNGDEDTALENIIPDNFDIEEYIEKKEEIELLHKAIASLSEREQRIVKWYFFDEMTQNDITKLDGTNQTNISHLKRKAVAKLRRYLNGRL